MILVIDNYDSFTYNLVHYLNELGARDVGPSKRCAERRTKRSPCGPHAVLLSPGPRDAGRRRHLSRV